MVRFIISKYSVFSSFRHLTKREQRILQRRKKVEHLLQWQKKLDNEEMAVRELEKKALDIVDHSRKKTKYYVLSSASTNQNGILLCNYMLILNVCNLQKY